MSLISLFFFFFFRAIEDHVKRACRDLVFDCVVVGAGRPSPALIIEPMLQGVNQSQLRQDIWNRIQPFQVRRYLHEQIAVRAILVVEQWSLPRTMVCLLMVLVFYLILFLLD